MLRRRLRCAVVAAVVVVGAGIFAVVPSLADNIYRQRDGDKVHWSDNPGGGPGYVTFVDHTGSNWPVYASAVEWDYAGNLNVIYQYGDCGGHGHCVGVDTQGFSANCNELGGFFDPDTQPNGHLESTSRIRFNNACNDRDQSVRRSIACEEEGHGGGDLDHEIAYSLHNETCMYSGADGYDATTPRRHDFEMLDDRIYDHND